MNRSEIVDLPVPDFQTGGFGTGLGSFRIEKGQSATQIVGSQGLLPNGECCEIRKLGDGEPDFRMTFFQGFTFGPVGISALLDWQKGSNIINLTKFLYDLNANSADFATAAWIVSPGRGPTPASTSRTPAFSSCARSSCTWTCRRPGSASWGP